MSKKIKVGNAEVEKTNYDYFLLMYEKMPKEYVVADLVSKCEDYDKLYKNYEMKDLQIEEIRKELINNDEYIGKLQKEYDKEIERLKEELEFEKASNKELISTGADLENKLYEEHKQTKTQLEMHIAFNKQLLGELEKLDNENKRLKKELQEEKEEKEHYQAIVESWE